MPTQKYITIGRIRQAHHRGRVVIFSRIPRVYFRTFYLYTCTAILSLVLTYTVMPALGRPVANAPPNPHFTP